ncbi:MAG: signal transduction histidine kinase [Gemmatimonadetes bacterium]|jgi:signal transduction histidine kinase|nr:signal transduction histidine kinase [Gemmatimonadota bacterium]
MTIAPSPGTAHEAAITSVALRFEDDVVLARQRARGIAAAVGLQRQDQVRFATAVSELARNAFEYGRGGRVTFRIGREGERSVLAAVVSDSGPGIADLPRILQGGYVSPTGLGIGIVGARRLVDRFTITSDPAGTSVAIGKVLGHLAAPLAPADVVRVADVLARQELASPFAELQRQNQDLVAALDTVREREAEALRLGQELAETNRGVVALYAELDDRAQQLARMSDYKTRFLSDVSHELRTPLSSIVNLTRLLLARSDGPLLPEQEKQLQMIHRSAEWLAEMVNELLDVAKIESGRVELRPDAFQAEELFAALRGVLRPLATNDAVALVIEEPAQPIALFTDEQRLAQVLRNFVSNALKFTAAGEVRVTAREEGDGLVRFVVADTGIGIAPADQERVFQDFAQVDGPIQRRVRGTGLGLPLTRKLAAILGGEVALESVVGEGSRFSLLIPRDVRTAGLADG